MMDTLPRVPDVNGVLDEKLYSDLYTRTSWVDASIALDQIEKVWIKASSPVPCWLFMHSTMGEPPGSAQSYVRPLDFLIRNTIVIASIDQEVSIRSWPPYSDIPSFSFDRHRAACERSRWQRPLSQFYCVYCWNSSTTRVAFSYIAIRITICIYIYFWMEYPTFLPTYPPTDSHPTYLPTSEHEPFEYDIIKTFKMVPLCGCATARGCFETTNVMAKQLLRRGPG